MRVRVRDRARVTARVRARDGVRTRARVRVRVRVPWCPWSGARGRISTSCLLLLALALERSTRYEHDAGAKCSVASPSSRGKIRSLRRVT